MTVYSFLTVNWIPTASWLLLRPPALFDNLRDKAGNGTFDLLLVYLSLVIRLSSPDTDEKEADSNDNNHSLYLHSDKQVSC